MFHSHYNLYFGRLPDGGVRILKLYTSPIRGDFPVVDQPYYDANVQLDITIPPGEWASIIAAVSKRGEVDRYNLAMAFHQE